MLKKIRAIATVTILSTGVLSASVTPASAFFGFSFGMDNQGPFMMFKDGPRFWHFNKNHPFGRYGTMHNRYGYGNGWNNSYQPGYRFGRWPGARAWNTSPWPGSGPWNTGMRPWDASPWNSGIRPWGGSPWGSGVSPWGRSPWGSGFSPWGGGPLGYGMNPMSGFSPF